MSKNIRIEYDSYHQVNSSLESGGLKIFSPITGETLNLTWVTVDGEQKYHVTRSGDGKRTTSDQLHSALLWLCAELGMLLSRHAVAVVLDQVKSLAEDTTTSAASSRKRTLSVGNLIVEHLNANELFPKEKCRFFHSHVSKITITVPGLAARELTKDAMIDIEFE
jgi:hypothetical protein